MDLNDYVFDALDAMNFTETTPIQEHAIPKILEKRDLIGVAQTGTGKTAAYLLPILSMLEDGDYPAEYINCVIMSPTRELAQQIDRAMQGFAYYLNHISSVAVYGGNDGIRYEQERESMRKGANIVVATPGRLISHISLGNVDLSHVSFFVLDEADRMLDMGFSEDILMIAKSLPENKQTIMFSATMPEKIRDLAKSIMHDPAEVKLAISKPAEKIQQQACLCYETQKIDLIKHFFKTEAPQRVIVFTGSKQNTKNLSISLKRAGYNADAMHSDLDQSERDEVMYKFRSNQIDILVATDIVARGIDIDDIQMVINFDVPHDAEDYVHRIGRTARAGRGGKSLTLVSEKDRASFNAIEPFLQKKIDRLELPKKFTQPSENGSHFPRHSRFQSRGGKRSQTPKKATEGGKKPYRNKRKPSGKKGGRSTASAE